VGVETFPNNRISVSSGLAAVVVELGTRACGDADPNAMQSTNHILLYGNNFGPNHSSTATQTTLSQLSVSHIELTSVLDSLGPTDSGAASETRLPDLLKPHSPYR